MAFMSYTLEEKGGPKLFQMWVPLFTAEHHQPWVDLIRRLLYICKGFFVCVCVVFRTSFRDGTEGVRRPLPDVLPEARLRQNADDARWRPHQFYSKPGLLALLAVCLLRGDRRALFQVRFSPLVFVCLLALLLHGTQVARVCIVISVCSP